MDYVCVYESYIDPSYTYMYIPMPIHYGITDPDDLLWASNVMAGMPPAPDVDQVVPVADILHNIFDFLGHLFHFI